MELKDKIDIISKKADIVNKKLIAYLAIAGGTWLYGVNPDIIPIIKILSSIVFLMSIFGIFASILKLSDLQQQLKGFINE